MVSVSISPTWRAEWLTLVLRQGSFTQTLISGWFDEDEHMGQTLGGPMCVRRTRLGNHKQSSLTHDSHL